MSGLRDNSNRRTRAKAQDALRPFGRFDPQRLEATFRFGGDCHLLVVKIPGAINQVTELSCLDLPSYPELVEAAYDHQVRHAPKPPRRKK